MPQVAAAASVTLTLAPEVAIEISTTGDARVTLDAGFGGSRFENHRIVVGHPKSFATPFGGKLTITGVSGVATYAAPARQAINPAEADALLTSLARPTTSKPYALRTWQRALSRVRAGKGHAVLACVGDSTTAGQYADGTNAWTGQRLLSYPAAIAAALTAASIANRTDAVVGDSSTYGHGGTLPGYNSQLTAGASYTQGVLDTAGGQVIYNAAGSLGNAAAETLTLTPPTSFDTVDIYWYRSLTVGTFTIDCGGAVLATCAAGAAGMQKTTVSKTAGTGVINIIRTVLGGIIICGIVPSLSTTKAVHVLNMGWSGARSSSWANSTGAYAPANTLPLYAADLTIINLGINDAILGVTAATYTTNMQTIITAAKTTGDVLLVTPFPVDVSVAAGGSQQALRDALITLAATNGVPLLDLQQRWADFTTADALGYMHTDKTHPVQIGYQDLASAVAQALLA